MTTVIAAVTESASDAGRGALRRAILRTLAYADVFDFPLDRGEIHRYLIGSRAPRDSVDEMLDADTGLRGRIECTGAWFHLRGRAQIAETRKRRAEWSAHLWKIARRYAAIIAGLPLVRSVAITGALAMDNAEGEGDIDLFILASPGRVWLCRLLVLSVVRLAALRGHSLCPNFVLSTEQLALRERNLFTAHEVAQMIPAAPTLWNELFREANRWTDEYLPNAREGRDACDAARGSRLTRFASNVLASRAFDPLERWERVRKIRRLEERARREGGSVAFSKDECRGHFAAHDARVLAEYAERASRLGAVS